MIKFFLFYRRNVHEAKKTIYKSKMNEKDRDILK
jgi:hypothetical protein